MYCNYTLFVVVVQYPYIRSSFNILIFCEAISKFGKKIVEGTPQEIANNQDVIEAYLGSRELAV